MKNQVNDFSQKDAKPNLSSIQSYVGKPKEYESYIQTKNPKSEKDGVWHKIGVLIGIGISLAIIAAVGMFLWWIGSMIFSPSPDHSSSTSKSCAADDLSCLGNKGVVAAGLRCASHIERLAKHSVKWTDKTFETKFNRFRWENKNAGLITYIGDKVEFQNGFGAFTPVTYECVLSADNNTVLHVSAREGRLPD